MSTFYVSTLGSDLTGDGTISNPFLSITKAVNVINNSDTISLLPGTYNIYSIINITKSITITGPNATINGSDTVFNIQANNVTITNITIESSSITNPVISIDRNSDGTTVPTLYTGNNITYCTLRYTSKCLYLNGTYNITNNTFGRCTGSTTATVITIYTLRGTCNISNNTLLDSEHILSIIYLSNSGSGTYLDLCNSKTGTLNIQNNNITNNSTDVKCVTLATVTKFLYQDYFNTYLNASTEDYNYNTKFNMLIDNNTITSKLSLKFIEMLTNDNLSYNMFDHVVISNNTNNYTFDGIINFNKLANSTTYTVDSIDQNRSIFNINNNTITSIQNNLSYHKLIHIDLQIPGIVYNTYTGDGDGTNGASTFGEIISPSTETGFNIGAKSVGAVTNISFVASQTLTYRDFFTGFIYKNYTTSPFMYYRSTESTTSNTVINIIESPIFSYVLVHNTIIDNNTTYPLINIDNNIYDINGLITESFEPEYYILDSSNELKLTYSSGDSNTTPIIQTSTIPLNTIRIDILVFGQSEVNRYIYNKTNSHICTPYTRTQPYKVPKPYIRLGYKGSKTIDISLFEFQVYNKELTQVEADNIATGLRTKYDAIM